MEYRSESIIDIYRLIVMWVAMAVDVLFGSTDGIFLTLIIFMSVDYVSGVCAAIANKKLSSRIGARGLARKFGILCIVSIATLIEENIMDTAALREVVILYYISNEGISILENITKLGVPIPRRIKDVLCNIVEDEEKDGDQG